jgi:hypothetical protein
MQLVTEADYRGGRLWEAPEANSATSVCSFASAPNFTGRAYPFIDAWKAVLAGELPSWKHTAVYLVITLNHSQS